MRGGQLVSHRYIRTVDIEMYNRPTANGHPDTIPHPLPFIEQVSPDETS